MFFKRIFLIAAIVVFASSSVMATEIQETDYSEAAAKLAAGVIISTISVAVLVGTRLFYQRYGIARTLQAVNMFYYGGTGVVVGSIMTLMMPLNKPIQEWIGYPLCLGIGGAVFGFCKIQIGILAWEFLQKQRLLLL